MARAMKCDICGKYYVSYGIGKDKYCDEARFDICPDCTKSFDDWLKEKRRSKKEEKDD